MNANDDNDDDMTKEETDRVKKTWRQICRDSTREQIVKTMAENIGIGNLIYSICDEELMKRDRADERKYRSEESRAVWAAVSAKNRPRILKRRKLSPKVKSVDF